jgi:hypothetical protein
MSFRSLFMAAALLSGCGSVCDTENACAVTGVAPGIQVCDGNSFVTCDETARGATVLCPRLGQRAICTTDGWTFTNNGAR